jgi:hypothetical protein
MCHLELGIKHALKQNTDATKQDIENGHKRSVVCVRNTTIHKDMMIPFVAQTLHTTYLRRHSTLILHPNPLISNIPQQMPPDRQHRRLKRKRHTDILTQH